MLFQIAAFLFMVLFTLTYLNALVESCGINISAKLDELDKLRIKDELKLEITQ